MHIYTGPTGSKWYSTDRVHWYASPQAAVQDYCRTCGFTNCPGATGGECPRWAERKD